MRLHLRLPNQFRRECGTIFGSPRSLSRRRPKADADDGTYLSSDGGITSSLVEEVERRLVASCAAEDHTADAFLKLAGFSLAEANSFAGQSWVSDPYTFELAATAFAGIIKEFRPKGEIKMPETVLPV